MDMDRLRVDTRARAEGAWITPDPVELPDVEIKTRGLGRRYFEALGKAERREKRKRNMPASAALPAEVQIQVNVDCLITEALLDVRGLTRRGVPVTFPEFCEAIRLEEYEVLRNAAFLAANAVGQQRSEEIEDAGNGSETA